MSQRDPQVAEKVEFETLPTQEVARIVRQAGVRVCAFPINGTRRWFMLEHGLQPGEDFGQVYSDVAGRRHIELYTLLFDHGIDTLLTPVFGGELLRRGPDYIAMIVKGLERLATHPDFVRFYAERGVRVRFYGDYRRFFQGTPYEHVCRMFDEATERTANCTCCRLFYGVCANDATQTVAEIGARFYQERGRSPTREEVVAAYYGEPVDPVSLFIGFGPFAAFDMPLLATGEESLYFTVAPGPYLDERTLRAILYDHIFVRREPDYETLPAEGWARMAAFYKLNRHNVQGLGVQRDGIWYPLPQVEFPDEW